MLKRFSRDRRGIAAVEFAICAPVMILLYYGVAELTLGMMAERRASHAASIVADLVAQTSSTTSSEVTDIFNVGVAILQPFPSTSLKLRVSAVTADASGVAKVVWSRGYGQGGLGVGPVAGFPSGLLAANESIIMTEMKYTYDSPLHQAVPSALNFAETFYLRPRKSSAVACSTC